MKNKSQNLVRTVTLNKLQHKFYLIEIDDKAKTKRLYNPITETLREERIVTDSNEMKQYIKFILDNA